MRLLQAKSIYLRGQRAKYKDFSKKAGLRVKNERLQELRFGRKVSNKVTATAERHHKDWLKSIGAENSSLNTLEKYYNAKYNSSEEYKRLTTRNKEFKILKSKHQDYTQEQISKCIALYNESENKGFIASSHFMEQFIKREYDKSGELQYTISEVASLLEISPKYTDARNNRLVLSNGKIHVVTENNRLVTLRLGRIVKQWRRI